MAESVEIRLFLRDPVNRLSRDLPGEVKDLFDAQSVEYRHKESKWILAAFLTLSP